MSAVPAESATPWRAPGVDADAAPLVTALLARLDRVLDDLHEVSCGALADAERRRLGDVIGARHTYQWWAGRSRRTHAEAARLGTALASEQHAPVGCELAAGRLRVEQARVIVEAVDALPPSVDVAVRERAEAALLELAKQHDTRDLKQIGKRILDIVAPEVGESREAAVLAAEESRADAGVELTLVDDGEGRCHGRFAVPSRIGAMPKRHLLVLANPARHTDAELRDESGDFTTPLRRPRASTRPSW